MSGLLEIALLLLGILTLVGFLGAYEWHFDLINHFRPQLLVLQLVGWGLLLLAGDLRQPKGKLWLFTGLMAINLFLVGPYYVPRWFASNTVEYNRIKIYLVNAGWTEDFSALVDDIARRQPDILCITEHNADLGQRIQQHPVLSSHFKYQTTQPTQNGLYSIMPFEVSSLPGEHRNQAMYFVSQVQFKPRPFTLILAHPTLPTSEEAYKRQITLFQYWATHRRDYGPSLIIAGDLNTTPWGTGLHHLLRRSDLQDSQLGFGVQPSFAFREPYAIPIDHVLTSPDFRVLRREVGPDVGSDHLPVYVELGLLDKR